MPEDYDVSGSQTDSGSQIDINDDPLFDGIGEAEETFEDVFSGGDSEDEKGSQDSEDSEEDSESKRREEQSFKDKFYASKERMDKLEQELAEIRSRSEKPTAKVDTDPIAEELSDYAVELDKLVEEGDISIADAKLRYKEQYMIRKTIRDMSGSVEGIGGAANEYRGDRNANYLTNSLEEMGLSRGSDEYNEALALLQKEWMLDPSDRKTMSRFESQEDLRKIAKYVSAVAKMNVLERKGEKKPPPKSTKGGSKPPPPENQSTGKFKSLREISNLAKQGKIR